MVHLPGKARQGKARQGKARQGKARQGEARQGGHTKGHSRASGTSGQNQLMRALAKASHNVRPCGGGLYRRSRAPKRAHPHRHTHQIHDRALCSTYYTYIVPRFTLVPQSSDSLTCDSSRTHHSSTRRSRRGWHTHSIACRSRGTHTHTPRRFRTRDLFTPGARARSKRIQRHVHAHGVGARSRLLCGEAQGATRP